MMAALRQKLNGEVTLKLLGASRPPPSVPTIDRPSTFQMLLHSPAHAVPSIPIECIEQQYTGRPIAKYIEHTGRIDQKPGFAGKIFYQCELMLVMVPLDFHYGGGHADNETCLRDGSEYGRKLYQNEGSYISQLNSLRQIHQYGDRELFCPHVAVAPRLNYSKIHDMFGS